MSRTKAQRQHSGRTAPQNWVFRENTGWKRGHEGPGEKEMGTIVLSVELELYTEKWIADSILKHSTTNNTVLKV